MSPTRSTRCSTSSILCSGMDTLALTPASSRRAGASVHLRPRHYTRAWGMAITAPLADHHSLSVESGRSSTVVWERCLRGAVLEVPGELEDGPEDPVHAFIREAQLPGP